MAGIILRPGCQKGFADFINYFRRLVLLVSVIVKMKPTDNIIGEASSFRFKVINDIDYSVVCTACDEQSFSVFTYYQVLLMCEIILKISLAYLKKQVSVARGAEPFGLNAGKEFELLVNRKAVTAEDEPLIRQE